MKKLIAIVLVWAIPQLPVAAAAVTTEFMQGLGDTHYQVIDSEVVGRRYHIYTMLPAGYDAKADVSYPTIYLLDGGALFPMLVSYYRYLNFAEEVPAAIIVGISYGNDNFAGGNFRSTDYTAPSTEREYWGGAGLFQEFLATELLPVVERKYRSNPARRIVFGQSLGGQFVLYSALTRPQLFWGHVASNPALHRNLPFFLKYHGDQSAGGSPGKLFVGSATGDTPVFREPAVQWIEHWAKQPEKPWRLKTTDLDGHSHMSAPPAAFRDGMRWLFSD